MLKPEKSNVIIPVRLDSQRLPKKAVLSETGKPLLVHTYENVCEAAKRIPYIDGIYVCSKDREVREICDEYNIPFVDLTSYKLECGSHACLVARKILVDTGKIHAHNNLVNIQVDYPILSHSVISEVCIQLARGCGDIVSVFYDDIGNENQNDVKVVYDKYFNALYFSRLQIPTFNKNKHIHIGIYGFHQYILNTEIDLNIYNPYDTYQHIINRESLEQNLWVEQGFKIHMIDSYCQELSINTEEDYEHFIKIMKERNAC